MRMRIFTLALNCAALAVLTLPAHAASVDVTYVHPETFTDVSDSYAVHAAVRAAYLDDLRRYLAGRAGRALLPGQTLRVAITNIDMAGGFEPWRQSAGNVRIIRDVYPPRIDLTFELIDAGGTIVREGERKLRDLTFLMTSTLRSIDPLRYEKALLDDWVEREFPPPKT